MGSGHYVLREGGVPYLVTRWGVSRGTERRLVRVEQAAPCVMCLTDSADPCTCVGYCGQIICHGDDPD
jgi:hypothetical protein